VIIISVVLHLVAWSCKGSYMKHFVVQNHREHPLVRRVYERQTTLLRTAHRGFALFVYVLATLYVCPFLDDYSKPFMQTRALWTEALGNHTDMIMASRCWPGDRICGLGWQKLEQSFSWPTLADKQFDAHVQRQMLIAWFCCVLELALFAWKQCVYQQFERCAKDSREKTANRPNRALLRLQESIGLTSEAMQSLGMGQIREQQLEKAGMEECSGDVFDGENLGDEEMLQITAPTGRNMGGRTANDKVFV
jgi:hypothetical protein